MQDWADGQPNYGMYGSPSNRGPILSEACEPAAAEAAWEPVLFIQYDRNQSPTTIADLSAADVDWYQVKLTWTSPDDRPSGTVAGYDIRYGTTAFPAAGDTATKEAWWTSATQIANEPAPLPAGNRQSYTVTNLVPSTAYSFAIRSIDRTGLISDIAAISATTDPMDITAPAAVALAVTQVGPNHVVLSWTAPGDDNNDPASLASEYDIRYSTSQITDGNFASATAVTAKPAPAAAGTVQTVRIEGLTPSQAYWFALKTRDEVPNWSALSNVPTVTTPVPDTQAPVAIDDLAVVGVHIRSVFLKWTTPADLGSAGLASYEIRYSTDPISSEAAWNSASIAPNSLVPGQPNVDQVEFQVLGLNPNTTYCFAVKSRDLAIPANVSALSNPATGHTMMPIRAITLTNPWIENDRVANTRNITTIGQTFSNAYTPNGVVAPTTGEEKAINMYNNIKRRIYHWKEVPPQADDITYNVNVFGWALCGMFQTMGTTVGTQIFGAGNAHYSGGNYGIPGGHNWYEVKYTDTDGVSRWHTYDPMTTFYIYNSATQPRHVLSRAEIAGYASNAVTVNAVAEGRACAGYLLCGDEPDYWYGVCGAGSDYAGSTKATLAMDMTLGMGQSLKRTCESWASQYANTSTTAPYHHEAAADWKDTTNFPYWEPYEFLSAQNTTVGISYTKTYRRWANGTFTITPDFRSSGYQADLYSSTNIKTYNDDFQTPDLRPATTGSPAEIVLKISTPFCVTDANISGTFTRASVADTNRIFYSPDGSNWIQVWVNAATGTTSLTNLNMRTQVNGTYAYYLKIQLQAAASTADAGLSNLVVQTSFEHNKGGMAYLDKGVNNLKLNLDNPTALAGGGGAIHVVYKWKENYGSGWTVDQTYERYFDENDPYPYTFAISVGGTKVPRTEYILLEVTEPPQPDTVAPAQIDNLALADKDSTVVDLAWTATGDDYRAGTATRYEIRYTTGSTPMDDAAWPTATLVSGTPAPAAANSAERFRVTGLSGSTTYNFAIKAFDEDSNPSPISNVVTATTDAPDVTPPGVITDLAAVRGSTSGTINLAWTAPGDDGNSGTADAYDLRYSTASITDGNFSSAIPVAGVPAPKAAGAAESFTVTGLPTGVVYYFAIKTRDEVPFWSTLSNVASAKAVLGQIILQQGLNSYGGCTDTYMQEGSPTGNYSSNTFLRVCGFNSPNRQRGLIKFDVSSIPTTATITNATLYLYAYSGLQTDARGGSYGIYRTYERWTPAETSWTIAKGTTAWTVAGGGGYNPTPNGTAAKQNTTGVWYAFDMTAIIQFLITNPDYNFGFLIKCLDESYSNQDMFYSAEGATTSLRPKLVITDLVTCTVTTTVNPVGAGTVSGGGSLAQGDPCTLTAAPALGYVFDHWQGGPVNGSTANPASFAVSGSVTVTAVFRACALGDVNGDGCVDLLDLLAMANAWATISTDAGYSAACDLDRNGRIDVIDLLILADNWP